MLTLNIDFSVLSHSLQRTLNYLMSHLTFFLSIVVAQTLKYT